VTTPGFLIVVFLACVGILSYLLVRERRLSRRQEVKESAYIRGLSALIDGEDQQAFDLLKTAVREDSENIDAYIRLGDLYRRHRRPQHAYQIHRGLLVRSGLPPSLHARVLQSMAEDLAALGKLERVREVLADLGKHAGDGALHPRVASIAEQSGDWERAYEIRREIWKGERGERVARRLALYRTWTASQTLRRDTTADVRDKLRDALKTEATCVPAHLALGDVLYLANDLSDAIHHWKRIIDQVPSLAFLTFDRLERAFFERGTLGRGTVGDLEAIYDRLLRDHPEDTTTLEALGHLHHKRGELADAIAVCQKAVEISPRSRAVRRRLVQYLHEAGRHRESERELSQLLQVLANGDVDPVARARESAALRPIWECTDLDDWNLFVAAFSPTRDARESKRR
jgi:lipopolysaccharide biosynthesis regulator YciM